jgi:hypothetical protein
MPDYANVSHEAAEGDYLKRMDTYATFFEPLDTGANKAVESKWSYFKVGSTLSLLCKKN